MSLRYRDGQHAEPATVRQKAKHHICLCMGKQPAKGRPKKKEPKPSKEPQKDVTPRGLKVQELLLFAAAGW